MKKLFTNVIIDDVTKAVTFVSNGSGKLSVHAFGTWVTGTIVLKGSLNGTDNGVTLATFTAVDDIKTLDVANEMTLWGESSGFTGGEDLNLWVAGQGND